MQTPPDVMTIDEQAPRVVLRLRTETARQLLLPTPSLAAQ